MSASTYRWKIEDFRFGRVVASGEAGLLRAAQADVLAAMKRLGLRDLRGRSATVITTGKCGTTRIWNGRGPAQPFGSLRWEEQESQA